MRNAILLTSLLLVASCSEMIESGAIDGYRSTLASGKYDQAIKALDLVEKTSKRYAEAQKIKANLQTGFQIFAVAQGDWRYQDGQAFYTVAMRPNPATWTSKLEGNTIYSKPNKCNNTGSALTECAWTAHLRYIDYEGNGRLRVRKYGADETKYEEYVVFP